MNMPNISFLKLENGTVGICANDTKALAWIMQSPPPKTVPILITPEVAKELAKK